MNIAAKKVIVVFKTHLDIGFTGLAQQVLDKYCLDFIPSAVELAFRVNTPQYKKFVWTVGSYLIRYYLHMPMRPAAAGWNRPSGWDMSAGTDWPAPRIRS